MRQQSIEIAPAIPCDLMPCLPSRKHAPLNRATLNMFGRPATEAILPWGHHTRIRGRRCGISDGHCASAATLSRTQRHLGYHNRRRRWVHARQPQSPRRWEWMPRPAVRRAPPQQYRQFECDYTCVHVTKTARPHEWMETCTKSKATKPWSRLANRRSRGAIAKQNPYEKMCFSHQLCDDSNIRYNTLKLEDRSHTILRIREQPAKH